MIIEALASPPASDELEVTVFGRGMGECVMCHLGEARWLMIDCFRDAHGRPVAEAYLERFGGDHRIVAAVATHWDDDHTHGLSEVFRHHRPDEMWMPIVLNTRELFRFAVEHDEAMHGRGPSGLRNFVDVLKITKGGRVRRWGIAGLNITTGTDAAVRLLSPVHETVDEGFAALGAAMAPGFGEVTSVSSNRTSIVLWLSWGGRCALLGADLEAGPNGWTAVLDGGAPDDERASVIKVPHHGSFDADEPRIWSEFASECPVNAVTRYTRLVSPLPRREDVERLAARPGDLNIAGSLPERLQPAHSAFDLHLEVASGTGLRWAHGPVGVIRARSSSPEDWRVERFGAVETAPAAL